MGTGYLPHLLSHVFLPGSSPRHITLSKGFIAFFGHNIQLSGSQWVQLLPWKIFFQEKNCLLSTTIEIGSSFDNQPCSKTTRDRQFLTPLLHGHPWTMFLSSYYNTSCSYICSLWGWGKFISKGLMKKMLSFSTHQDPTLRHQKIEILGWNHAQVSIRTACYSPNQTAILESTKLMQFYHYQPAVQHLNTPTHFRELIFSWDIFILLLRRKYFSQGSL